MRTVRYKELGLDQPLQAEDQYLASGNMEWRLIDTAFLGLGLTPRRFAALGTRWRRPFFEEDDTFIELPCSSEREAGDMSAY